VFWNVSKVVLRGRRNNFVTLSEDLLQVLGKRKTFALDGLHQVGVAFCVMC
jgi:hypothetical protein